MLFKILLWVNKDLAIRVGFGSLYTQISGWKVYCNKIV